MKKPLLTQLTGFVAGAIVLTFAQFAANAQTNYQRGGDIVGIGSNAWSYLIMEGESYTSEVNADPGVGFVKAYGDGAITNFYGNPVLATNTTGLP